MQNSWRTSCDDPHHGFLKIILVGLQVKFKSKELKQVLLLMPESAFARGFLVNPQNKEGSFVIKKFPVSFLKRQPELEVTGTLFLRQAELNS